MGMSTGGIPTTDNLPETTEKLGCPTDKIPDNRFSKTLNFIIFIWNKTNSRTHEYLFKVLFHNNVVLVIKSKSKILINSLKSAYNLALIIIG